MPTETNNPDETFDDDPPMLVRGPAVERLCEEVVLAIEPLEGVVSEGEVVVALVTLAYSALVSAKQRGMDLEPFRQAIQCMADELPPLTDEPASVVH